MLKIQQQLPDNLLQLPAEQLYQHLDNHSLILLEGKIKRPLFISLLQHGDETTGWDALRIFLNNHQNRLPRTLCLYFSNMEAAQQGVRYLPSQVDFNRCWPGKHNSQHPTAKIMAEITATVKAMNPFAAVDIHNNTGRNPNYAGINRLDKEFVNLASLFSDTIIHFTNPDGIQSGAFAKFCPSVTLECGKTGTTDGLEQTITFLENLIHQSSLQKVPGIAEHQRVMNIFATVKVRPKVRIKIADQIDQGCDFAIHQDLDFHNFRMLNPGTSFGKVHNGSDLMPLLVTDQFGNNITAQYFAITNDKIVLTQRLMPAMITQSIQAIRMDCLCYLMKPLTQENTPEQAIETME